MKKALLILLVLGMASCDSRPVDVYEKSLNKPTDALVLEHNGIRYLFLDTQNEDRRGWVVDYSQFFNQDTISVNGNIWIRSRTKEEDADLRIPETEPSE
jgi:hypothetical protein